MRHISMTVIPISQRTTVNTSRMCFLNVTVNSLVEICIKHC